MHKHRENERTRKLSHLIRIQSELIYSYGWDRRKKKAEMYLLLAIVPRDDAKDGKFREILVGRDYRWDTRCGNEHITISLMDIQRVQRRS